MSSTKCLSVLLLACLLYNVASADLPDPSKYTVTFRYDDTDWCLGAIIDEDKVVTSGECFGDRHGLIFNFLSIKASVKAVVGSVELEVESVYLPAFVGQKDRSVHDFAVVKLKQSLDLEKNGLVALKYLPRYLIQTDHVGFSVKGFVDDSNDVEELKIVDPANCPSTDDEIFYPDSQLCVELPKENDNCLHQPGTPLVNAAGALIGVYLDCYDESPYEIFANVSFFALPRGDNF